MKSCRKGYRARIMAQSYEIVNSKTHVRFGRKFDTRKEANEFIKYLQANTNLKLNWVAKPWPYKREGNPTVSTANLPIGTWQPAHAIRQNADGSVDILREKNSGRRANISEGFMAGGVFHPIRSASDYDESRAGEKRKPGTRKVAKKKVPRSATYSSRIKKLKKSYPFELHHKERGFVRGFASAAALSNEYKRRGGAKKGYAKK